MYAGHTVIKRARVVLYFAPASEPEPRFEAWNLETLRPIFAVDVTDVQPNQKIEFNSVDFSVPDALAFIPNDLSAFANKSLYVQALISQGRSNRVIVYSLVLTDSMLVIRSR